MKKTVLIYRYSLLPASETFIKLQASLIKDWNPILFGLDKSKNSLDLSGIQHYICTTPKNLSIWKRVYRKIKRVINSDAVDLNILDQAKALRPNLIHAHFAVDALDAYKLAKALKIKLVVTMHGYDVSIFPEFWRSGQMGECLRNYPVRLAEIAHDPDVSFIAVSNALKMIAINQFDIPAEKVKVIYLGINPEDFPESPISMEKRPLKVLFVGRMVEKKAPDVLIKAFAQVQHAIPQAELVMIGDGPILAEMKQLALKLHISINFMGEQPPEIVRKELESSRIFCLPSIRAKSGDCEGMGIVLLEAQSTAVPVITSANGGKDEGMINNITGWSFEENDSEALSKILLENLANLDNLKMLAKAGPGFIREKHNAIKQSAELVEHFNNLVN